MDNDVTIPNSIAKLSAALAKAQGEFPAIPKDSEVEVKSRENKLLYKFKYADLTAIISSTRPAMSKNGLSFTQGVVPGGFVTTILHESGEQLLTGFIPCNIPTNADMKTVAGLITYVKRISLTAALGVSADEDVDAAHNEGEAGNSTQKRLNDSKPRDTDPVKQPEMTVAEYMRDKPSGEHFVVPSGTHAGKKLSEFTGFQLNAMLVKIEEILAKQNPKSVVLMATVNNILQAMEGREQDTIPYQDQI